MFYKFCFLIDGRISFFLHYHPTHHPFSPVLNRQARALSGARAVRFRFYILYFAFFSRVRSAFPAFAGRYSSIQVPNTLFWWLGTSINRFFITGMLGIGASGLYAAASKIPNLLNLAYSIFQQAWQLSTFQEYRKSDIGKFFSMILIPLQAVLTVGASFIMLISQLLASFMLQKSFYSAWTLIPVVLLGFYFSCMNTFYGTVYTTLMKTKYLMTTTIVGSLVCVIATAGLIPVALRTINTTPRKSTASLPGVPNNSPLCSSQMVRNKEVLGE